MNTAVYICERQFHKFNIQSDIYNSNNMVYQLDFERFLSHIS